MESFKNELKQVLRRLGRAPMFTAITLITLAAGVGANTVVFSAISSLRGIQSRARLARSKSNPQLPITTPPIPPSATSKSDSTK